MHAKLITVLLLIVGLINFLPVIGLFSTARMEALYGIDIADPNLEILMRHRALLFGLVGGFVIVAAFVPSWQPAAMGFALISMAGFVLVALTIGDFNAGIRKVIVADVVGLAALLPAVALYFLKPA